MPTDDIVKVDYNLGGDAMIAKFREENLGDHECACCDLVEDARQCEAVALVTQQSIAQLDAQIIKLRGEIEAGKLQVKNTDMKEKSIEAQIDKFDRDIDLADDAVDATELRLNTLEKSLRGREEALDSKEGGLQLSLGDETSLRSERISELEAQLFEKQQDVESMRLRCTNEGLMGPEAGSMYCEGLKDTIQDQLGDLIGELDGIVDETKHNQQEICDLIKKLDSKVLRKIERQEQKAAVFVRKHLATRLLRIKYQEENKKLRDQIRALESGAVDSGSDDEDIKNLGSDDEIDSSLHLLLELPEPSVGLLDNFKGSEEMDADLIALQAMMGSKTKQWKRVKMFLEGVLEWDENAIGEVQGLLHGVDNGVTWVKLHNVFEHIAVHAGMKLEHRPWWRTGEWKWVEH